MHKAAYVLAGFFLWLGSVQTVMTEPLFGVAQPLIASRAVPLVALSAGDAAAGASLFAGRRSSSLFAPRAVPQVDVTRPGVAGLRDLIARAEAGPAQYDAVVWSARIKPTKKPTQMTIAEIYDWIKKTPGQNHAIGRYQVIPATLRSLVKKMNVPQTAIYSPALQDQMADRLMRDAGLDRFLSGELGRYTFMNNLAKVWAGLPTSSGKSYYHGFAGNKAVITRAHFEEEMARLFPAL